MLAALGIAIFAGVHAQVADDAREDRWAQEVAPQVVVGEVVWLATPRRAKVLALYTEVSTEVKLRKGGVIIVHGLGVHPDWGLNGVLRTQLADRGFATLSVQMPVLGAGATREQYRALYPLAGERIAAALRDLRGRGITKVAIVSHSLGAGMVDAYLTRPDALPIAAWVPVGMLVDFSQAPREPTLDVVAGNDFPEVLASVKLRMPRLPRDRCSRVVTVAETDHYFERATEALNAAIVPFLDRAFAGDC
jgi:alpha/beta superfamily hydrolase